MRGGERERESERGRRMGGEGWEGRMKGERVVKEGKSGEAWGGGGDREGGGGVQQIVVAHC